MRNARVFLPQSSVLSAETTFALAPTFSLGETESSRSRNTRSALLATAFSIMRSLLAGVDNSDRLKRMARSFRHCSFVPLLRALAIFSSHPPSHASPAPFLATMPRRPEHHTPDLQ